MPLKRKKSKAPGKSVPHSEEFDAPFVPVIVNPVKVDLRGDVEALSVRVVELEGDLCRIVDLIVKGDIDSVKFKEILAKRQGANARG